jgi:hypothetical protein
LLAHFSECGPRIVYKDHGTIKCDQFSLMNIDDNMEEEEEKLTEELSTSLGGESLHSDRLPQQIVHCNGSQSGGTGSAYLVLQASMSNAILSILSQPRQLTVLAFFIMLG